MQLVEKLRRWTTWQCRFACGTVSAALLCFGLGHCLADGPGADGKIIEGRVKSMTTAPKGEVDGAVLDDGSVLHWPPHMSDEFTEVVSQGTLVRASGRFETGPKGDAHFEVETVTDTRTNKSVTNDDFRDGPPQPPRGPRSRERRPAPKMEGRRGEIENVTGTVRRFTTAPRGETDGAILSDGTWLHWPPHMDDRFTALLKVGDQIRATGRRQVAPRGEEHFEVQHVTNTRDGRSADNPDFEGPVSPVTAREELSPKGTKRFDILQRKIDELQRELDRLRQEN